MLFNSYQFLFFFLPITVGVFFLIGRLRQQNLAIAWLVLASLFFYGFWNPIYLVLIIASMIGNYWFGRWVTEDRAPTFLPRRSVLILGITANLATLGYFKYANFFVDNLNLVAGTEITLQTIVLPLAISFFTFQQIAFLVDSYRGEAKEYSFLHYALFVTFFPQLIAGPIVHHKEMLPQFGNHALFSPSLRGICMGLTWIAIGLFKKVEIADALAGYATQVFGAADAGYSVWFVEAWAGALAYTFQLYFDFSGYVDMAMGSAMLIGIRLPANFDSPYKSLNIIDFWRRWHMTLSRFLRDYLYIALGGNRYGKIKRYRNLLLTMLLGGLWHGAAWTFVFWGALHGMYLVINHAWHALRQRLGLSEGQFGWYGAFTAWSVTFVAVVIGWVFFRAETFAGAWSLLGAMFGVDFMVLPEQLSGRLAGAEGILLSSGFNFDGRMVISLRDWLSGAALIVVALLIAVGLPNTGEIFSDDGSNRRFRWRVSGGWAVFAAVILAVSVIDLGRVSEFLYFNF